ncbi:hypothetical protein [Streptomyces sp. SID12501]|uniref:Uncharacterized protein n=1 Tax=Streptomyces sp. SID12501 TaxID=2706042 RepID=A0A6B3BM51_9ACTN|nr:hypothetical protein [Streptomyces sp. SID12501]NEC84816.1 hypothetical protein [Streptomyces sp. SID12501]
MPTGPWRTSCYGSGRHGVVWVGEGEEGESSLTDEARDPGGETPPYSVPAARPPG